MTDKMREEFETAVALEAKEPVLAVYLSRRDDTYSTSTLHFAWWAWKQSRADLNALVGAEQQPTEVERLQASLVEMTRYRDNAANHMRRIRAEATAFEKERDQLKVENEALRKKVARLKEDNLALLENPGDSL